MNTLRFLTFNLALAASLLAPHLAAQARFETIHEFTGSPDGAIPVGLIAGSGGALYGTTVSGGAHGYGSVFELQPPSTPGAPWTETVLYSFAGYSAGDGEVPAGPPAFGLNGALYGVTDSGGYFAGGAAFELAPPSVAGGAWTETVLASLLGPGYCPCLGVVMGSGGEFYAETITYLWPDYGEVFATVPPTSSGGSWTLSNIYVFPVDSAGVGRVPVGLTISPAGVLYGATTYGGSSGAGVIFELLPPTTPGGAWTEDNLYEFTGGTDGDAPLQPPVQASDGDLYGTTSGGGVNGTGVVYKLTPAPGGAWTESVLYSFGKSGDGKTPNSSLVVQHGTIVGTTAAGTGAHYGGGTIFELQNPGGGGAWTETILHGFANSAGPYGNLVLGKSGEIYGFTSSGGAAGMGTVYRITH